MIPGLPCSCISLVGGWLWQAALDGMASHTGTLFPTHVPVERGPEEQGTRLLRPMAAAPSFRPWSHWLSAGRWKKARRVPCTKFYFISFCLFFNSTILRQFQGDHIVIIGGLARPGLDIALPTASIGSCGYAYLPRTLQSSRVPGEERTDGGAGSSCPGPSALFTCSLPHG